MDKKLIIQLKQKFEDFVNEKDNIEFWFARDLQGLLGYSKWENFAKVIEKAKESCQNAGFNVNDHFPDVRKTINMPKGAKKYIPDLILTRYACYLIAQNGDPRKEQIQDKLTKILVKHLSGGSSINICRDAGIDELYYLIFSKWLK